MALYQSAEEMIGKTPLLSLARYAKKMGVVANLFAKIEQSNPAGSAKDRAAKEMLDEAERQGKIKAGATIIEPTSGNTGIGLASVAAVRGYRTVIVMPENMSEERKRLLRAFGAELVLTPANEGMAGAIKKAEELAKRSENCFLPSQFENPANPAAHYKTTGPEIYRDLDGRVDAFVAGVGTGGTVSGVGRYLKEKNKNVRIVGVEPADSPVLSGGKAGAHTIQGIGAGFLPAALDRDVLDEVMTVSEEEAFAAARALPPCEGILPGISGGAALSCAVRLGRREEMRGKNVVVLLPDAGDRYLSTSLYK